MSNDNSNQEQSESQDKKIYEYYKNGGVLTTLDALNLFQTMNLRSRNSTIEKKYSIRLKRFWVKGENGKRFLKYFLIASNLTKEEFEEFSKQQQLKLKFN